MVFVPVRVQSIRPLYTPRMQILYEKVCDIYVQCIQTPPAHFYHLLAPLHFIAAKVILENGLDQLLFVDLAHRVARYMIHHSEHLWNLVCH